MSAGHRHPDGVEPPDASLLAYVTDEAVDEINDLIANSGRDMSHDIPLLGDRTPDASLVYGDRHLPPMLHGLTVIEALAWHELSEWYFMHECGLPYMASHRLATFCFERPYVEHFLGGETGWDQYQEFMGAEIADAEERYRSGQMTDIPEDLDVTPDMAKQDKPFFRKLAAEIIALFKDSPDVADVHVSTTGKGPGKKISTAYVQQTEKVYDTNDDLPSAVKQLSGDDQTKWRKVWNNAFKEYKDEQKAFATAWAAVKKSEDDAEVEFSFTVTKIEPDKRQIFGWASVSSVNGQDIIDKQGDIVPIAELEKAAYDFMLWSRQQGDMHEKRGVGRCIESVVFTPEKAAAGIMAKNENGEPLMGWWVGFFVDDDTTWQAHRENRRPEFSIGGRASSVAA